METTGSFLRRLSKQRPHHSPWTGAAIAAMFMGVLVALLPSTAWALPSWQFETAPVPVSQDNYLNGVSCMSAASCTAVGSYLNRATPVPNQTLVESWTGSSVHLVSSPNVLADGNPLYNQLSGVSCVRRTSTCVAVGYYDNSDNVEQTLVESSSGSSWTIGTIGDSGTGNNQLNAVSCLSTRCTAVGYSTNTTTGNEQALIEMWNGSTWTIATSADEGTENNVLSAVSCVSTRACKAVGSYDTSGNVVEPLIESWNGSAWSVASDPDVGTGSLNGVSCVSIRRCTAVGGATSGTLIESWNGDSWTTVASADPGTVSNEFTGVSCVSARSCKAVGGYLDSGNPYDSTQTLIETWNGSAWSIQPSPNLSTDNNQVELANILSGVSCGSRNSCKAVGYYANPHDLSGNATVLIQTYG